MKKTDLEKRVAKTLKKAGWNPCSFKRHDGAVRFGVCAPTLNHELKSIVVHFDVSGASVCEYSTSINDDALRNGVFGFVEFQVRFRLRDSL